jgi:hypothetical protein
MKIIFLYCFSQLILLYVILSFDSIVSAQSGDLNNSTTSNKFCENVCTPDKCQCVGMKGGRGPPGKRGLVGPRGSKGNIGRQGIQGHKGDRGKTGKTGSQGSKGEMGPTGEMGHNGRIVESS